MQKIVCVETHPGGRIEAISERVLVGDEMSRYATRQSSPRLGRQRCAGVALVHPRPVLGRQQGERMQVLAVHHDQATIAWGLPEESAILGGIQLAPEPQPPPLVAELRSGEHLFEQAQIIGTAQARDRLGVARRPPQQRARQQPRRRPRRVARVPESERHPVVHDHALGGGSRGCRQADDAQGAVDGEEGLAIAEDGEAIDRGVSKTCLRSVAAP